MLRIWVITSVSGHQCSSRGQFISYASEEDVERLWNSVNSHHRLLLAIEPRLAELENRSSNFQAQTDQRLSNIEQNVGRLATALERVTKQCGTISGHIASMADALAQTIRTLEDCTSAVEGHGEVTVGRLDQITELQNDLLRSTQQAGDAVRHGADALLRTIEAEATVGQQALGVLVAEVQRRGQEVRDAVEAVNREIVEQRQEANEAAKVECDLAQSLLEKEQMEFEQLSATTGGLTEITRLGDELMARQHPGEAAKQNRQAARAAELVRAVACGSRLPDYPEEDDTLVRLLRAAASLPSDPVAARDYLMAASNRLESPESMAHQGIEPDVCRALHGYVRSMLELAGVVPLSPSEVFPESSRIGEVSDVIGLIRMTWDMRHNDFSAALAAMSILATECHLTAVDTLRHCFLTAYNAETLHDIHDQ